MGMFLCRVEIIHGKDNPYDDERYRIANPRELA